MNYLNQLLQVKKVDRSIIQIILLWEVRRFLYNSIILVAGIISIITMITAASEHVYLQPGEDFYEPIMIPIFAFLCNVCYTLGWLTEIFIKRGSSYGPKMFKVGLYFTLFWVFLPTTIWVIIAAIDIVRKVF